MTDGYEFSDLPLSPIDRGTNVLVTGPALGGIREVVLQMLASGDPDREGRILLTTDKNGTETLADIERIGGRLNPDRLGIIDAAHESSPDCEGVVRTVETPADLTGMGMEFSVLYQKLDEYGIDRVRTGLCTLSPVIVYAEDLKPVFRFLHTMTGRIRTAGGLGVFAIDPETQDEQALSSIMQAFDARIEVRPTGDTVELCVRGLHDQRSDWRAVPLEV